MNEVYWAFVRERLALGDDPNQITRAIEEALEKEATDWSLFGTGQWVRETVCSLCGKWAAGVCGHQNDPAQRVIPRSEYAAVHRKAGESPR